MTVYLAEFSRLLICVVMIAGVVGKCASLRAFKESLSESGVLPLVAVPPVAVGVIAAEALTATLVLVNGPPRQVGYGLALVLLCAFTIFLVITLVSKTEVSCNCFGGTDEPVSGYDVVRNIVLIAALGAAWSSAPVISGSEAPVFALLCALAFAAFLALTNLATIVFLLRYRGPGNE